MRDGEVRRERGMSVSCTVTVNRSPNACHRGMSCHFCMLPGQSGFISIHHFIQRRCHESDDEMRRRQAMFLPPAVACRLPCRCRKALRASSGEIKAGGGDLALFFPSCLPSDKGWGRPEEGESDAAEAS